MKKISLLFTTTLTCTFASQAPIVKTVDKKEAFSYEHKLLKEYNSTLKEHQKALRQKVANKTIFIQPKNKKIPCKISADLNRSKLDDFASYWDGECKDGYAQGIGREIELTKNSQLEQIAYYEKGEAQKYCYGYDYNSKTSIYGICTYGSLKPMFRKMLRKNSPFTVSDARYPLKNISYHISTATNGARILTKAYPNFAYQILEHPKTNKAAAFVILTPKIQKPIGWGFNGNMVLKDGQPMPNIKLPKKYLKRVKEIYKEITKEAQKIKTMATKSKELAEQHKKKICKEDVKVDFMDNNLYKDICTRD